MFKRYKRLLLPLQALSVVFRTTHTRPPKTGAFSRVHKLLVGGKLGETRKVFKVKSTKSARNVEINNSRIAESASRAALLGRKMLIA
jgi:hypothetical protein